MYKGVKKCRDLDARNYYQHRLIELSSDAEFFAYGSKTQTDQWK